MNNHNSDEIEILEFMDLLHFTFSNDFIEKWRHKFSTNFVIKFQNRLFEAVNDKKPVKKTSLTQYLIKKCKYSEEVVQDFYDSIEIGIYYPLIL